MSMRLLSILGIVGAAAFSSAVLLRSADSEACCSAQQSEAPAADAKTVTLNVEGMTCGSCTVTVRTVLKKLDGVQDATVQLKEKRAIVQYDASKVTPDKMVEAINKAGYKASVAS